MFSLESTLILYNGLFLFALILLYGRHKTLSKYLAYIFLALASILRYDVGADYDGYYYDVQILKSVFDGEVRSILSDLKLISVGPIFSAVVFFLRDTTYTIVYVVGLYSLIQVILLYKVLERYNSHFWGVILYIISCLMFNVWDLLKQGLALMIVLNSFLYIEERNVKKFCTLIFIAGLAHYSAWLLFPFYWLVKATFKYRRSISIVILLFFLAQFGVFNTLAAYLNQIVPYYSQAYSDSVHFSTSGETVHDASYLFTVMWYIVLLSFAPRQLNVFKNLIFIGVCIYIMSGGNLLMDRISLYFTSSVLIYFRFVYEAVNKFMAKKGLILIMLSMMFALFNIRIMAMTYKGSAPYETVFSEECRLEIFRDNE